MPAGKYSTKDPLSSTFFTKSIPEAKLEPNRTFTMELFTKIVNG